MVDNVYDEDKPRLALMAFPAAIEYLASLGGNYFLPLVSATRDWWKVLLVYSGFYYCAEIVFEDGRIFRLDRSNLSALIAEVETREALRDVRHGEKNGVVYMKFGSIGVRSLRSGAASIANAFKTMQYDILDVKGRTVVDIGAYVGDTAIYYAVAGGAKKVYAIEPVRSLFEIAKKNVRLNGLSDKIHVLKLAVAGRGGGHVTISDGFGYSAEKGVSTVSLDSLVKKYAITHGALKVDCEGCEYDIFRHVSSETLKCFDAINVEYHHGHKDIVERLKKEGYEVRYTKPKRSFTNIFRTFIISGDIVAKRK